MAKLTIRINSLPRPEAFWNVTNISRLLPRLFEINESIGGIYKAIESVDLPLLAFTVRAKLAGWTQEHGGAKSADLDLVITAKQHLLERLVKNPQFQEERLDLPVKDGAVDVGAALAAIQD